MSFRFQLLKSGKSHIRQLYNLRIGLSANQRHGMVCKRESYGCDGKPRTVIDLADEQKISTSSSPSMEVVGWCRLRR